MPALGWLLNLDFAGSGGVAISYTSYGSPWLYNAANWQLATFEFESYMRASAGTVYSRLYDVTGAAAVSGSDLDTTSATFVRQRTSNVSGLSFTEAHEYRAQFAKSADGAGEFLAAHIVAART